MNLADIKQKKQKIFVTGGNGYLGGRLLEKLEHHGIEYISIDKLHASSAKNLSFDLCDSQQIAKAFKDFKPDVVVHCATHSALAYKNDFFASFKEDALVLFNILGAIHKKTRLIFFSSSYVYSGLTENKVSEESKLQPTHNFGVGKAFFEQFILRNHANSVIFRLCSVFGEGNSLHPNAIFSMASEAAKGQLNVWGSGKRLMQYVSMEDVLAYIYEGFSLAPGIYNLGGNEYVSVADTADLIAKYFNANVTFLKEKSQGETLPFAENAKLKQTATHFTKFQDSLTEYLAFVKKKI